MTEFTIELYEDTKGNKPVEIFLLSLDDKMRIKLLRILEILQEKGPYLREPYSKSLGDGIFEVRGKSGSDITRILYFFYYDGKIILTNGFIKKSQKTPPSEFKLAKKRRNEYIRRMCNENIK